MISFLLCTSDSMRADFHPAPTAPQVISISVNVAQLDERIAEEGRKEIRFNSPKLEELRKRAGN